MSSRLIYIIFLIWLIILMHNLQLAFRMIYGSIFARTLLVSRLIFKCTSTTTECWSIPLIDSFLIDIDWIGRVTFFITNSPCIRLCRYFPLIIKMRITFHILQLLLICIIIGYAPLYGHCAARSLFNIDSNIASSRLRHKLHRSFLIVESLFIMNVAERIITEGIPILLVFGLTSLPLLI